MKLEDIHDCEKCHGKMVLIGSDNLGNTTCGYCGEKVDYKPYMKEMIKKHPGIQHHMDEAQR